MKCTEIFLEMEELSEEINNPAAEEYIASVMEKAQSICETVERFQNESDSQITAMENMRNGMQRWVRNG